LKCVEEDEELGMNAAEVLAEWKLPEVLAALQKRAQGGYAAPRSRMIWIRLQLGDRAVIPEFLKIIERGEGWVCQSAMAAAAACNLREAVPGIVTRLRDVDRKVSLSAASALLRMGRREGVDILLEEYRGYDLMNLLKRPEEFLRLDQVPIQGSQVGTARQIVERIARDAGLTVEGPPPPWSDAPEWDRNVLQLANGGNRPSRREMLNRALLYDFDYICEPGRIRIVRLRESSRFWRSWWEEQRKK
jgi:hypothetical protein